MKARTSARVAWSLWSAEAAFVVVSVVHAFTHPGSAGDRTSTAVFVVFVMAFSSVGALVASRRPGNPIGWLLLGAALCYTLGGLSTTQSQSPAGSWYSPAVLLNWVSVWVWSVGLALAVVSLLLFPNGRLPSRRWRVAMGLAIAGQVGFVLGSGFGSRFLQDTHIRNPFAVGGPLGAALRGLQPLLLLVPVAAVLALISIVVRYRRAGGAEREQIKWLLYAALLVAVGLLAQIPVSALLSSPDAVTNAQNAIVSGTVACVPIAIGIAILRYRLYDIDRIINRSLVYVLLTAVLGGVYAGLAVGLGAVVGSKANSLVIAGSTLVVAALFTPARRRIQGFIDRRFYRRRYDATRTLEAFTTRLREEVDLGELEVHLLDVVRDTMQPAQASLWLRAGGEAR
jgi:MFS family permease